MVESENKEYKFKGQLDVESTIRKIRDDRIKNGRYNGHSKYLWRALELRNDGYDNFEIADKLSIENNSTVTKVFIQKLFDDCGIESNPLKPRNKRSTASEIIMDKETFDKVDIECLKTGQTPTIIMQEMLGGKINGVTYTDRRSLLKIWKASYNKYIENK